MLSLGVAADRVTWARPFMRNHVQEVDDEYRGEQARGAELFQQFSAGKLDAALALMADTATWWVGGKPDTFALAGTKTKTQFAELLQGIGTAMPKGLRVTPRGLTAEGDRVAVEAESYGETARGKIYNNQYHFLFEVRKIQAVREYPDTMHAKEVLVDQ